VIEGVVGNIQKFSIHDGPGIRSTLFIKGCPLICAWCHNPESISFEVQTIWQQDRCLGCGDCLSACPAQALRINESDIARDKSICRNCGECAEACPALAWKRHGYRRGTAEVITDILKDRAFYESSGGGVTLSGGEPLCQPEFSLEALSLLKYQGIHAALDTSGHASWEILERFVPLTDLFLYDIKHLDTVKHRQYMGVDNDLILSNLEKLASRAKEIWVRIPIVPGVNDDEEHILAVGDLIKRLGIKRVHLLPYHGLAENKYRKLDMTYTLGSLEPPSAEKMQQLHNILQEQHLEVHIGG